MPGDVELSTGSLPPFELVDSTPVEGKRLRPADGADMPSGAYLRVGDRGVSVVMPPSETVTVRFDECAALLRSPNGTRVLIGMDYARIEVSPRVWNGAGKVASLIDAGVPSDRHVDIDDDDPPPQQVPRQGANWRGQLSGAILIGGLLAMVVNFDAGWHRPLSPGGMVFLGTCAIVVLDLIVSLWRWGRWESGRW